MEQSERPVPVQRSALVSRESTSEAAKEQRAVVDNAAGALAATSPVKLIEAAGGEALISWGACAVGCSVM